MYPCLIEANFQLPVREKYENSGSVFNKKLFCNAVYASFTYVITNGRNLTVYSHLNDV